MELKINSKKYGNKIALIDDEDYERMIKDFGNATWCLSINQRNGDFYLNKRHNGKKYLLHRYLLYHQNQLFHVLPL